MKNMAGDYGRRLLSGTTVRDDSRGQQQGTAVEDNGTKAGVHNHVQCGLHTTIKKWELQGVQRGVQCNRLFVNKYKMKKKIVHPRINSFVSVQSQLIR